VVRDRKQDKMVGDPAVTTLPQKHGVIFQAALLPVEIGCGSAAVPQTADDPNNLGDEVSITGSAKSAQIFGKG
jgi:hypothetical protein